MTDAYVEERPDPFDEVEGGGFSIRDAVLAVRRRWMVVLGVFLAVVGIGLWRSLREPRRYSAASTVRIQERQAPISGVQLSGPQYDYRIDPLLSEQQVIKSQVIAERAASASGLRVLIAQPPKTPRSEIFGGTTPVADSSAPSGEYRLRFGESAYALESGSHTYGTAAYGSPLRAMGLTLTVPRRPAIPDREVVIAILPLPYAASVVRGGVSTRVVPSTDIIEVSYLGTDPELVRDVANAVAQEYAGFSREVARVSATGKSDFIEQKLAEQEARLQGAQDSLKQFRERYQTADVSAEQGALFDNIYKFEQQKRDILLEQRIYETLLGRLAAADTTDTELRQLVNTPAVKENTNIATLYAQWFDLSKQRQQLLSRGYTPRYYDVRTVDSLIARTKADLANASRLYLQSVHARLASMDDNIRDLRRQTERFPPLVAEQARLMTNVKTQEQIYADLQQQYTLARIAQSVDAGSVQIIDPAGLPTIPVSPNRRRSFAISILLGLMLGTGLAMLLEKLDDSVKSPEDIRDRLETTVLGAIPAIRLADSNGHEDPIPGRLVTHADPRSPVAEAYRSLRTNLVFARAHLDVQTLVFTSPGPSDGKSTTVANLAITFAQQGQRTLLVDADLRRAVLNRTFDFPRSPGLTDVIVGTRPLATVIHDTRVQNLSVLGSGDFPPNPSELLGSPGMRRVLVEAKETFDVVLFDSPPLLAVTDAAVLSTMVDGSVVVVRMGVTAREAVRRALNQLRTVHGRVLGVVLNDVDFKKGAYYGAYGYYYSAYYGGESNGHHRNDGVVGRLQTLLGRKARGHTRA